MFVEAVFHYQLHPTKVEVEVEMAQTLDPEVYSSSAIRVVDWQSTMYFGNPKSFSPHLPNIPNPPIHS